MVTSDHFVRNRHCVTPFFLEPPSLVLVRAPSSRVSSAFLPSILDIYELLDKQWQGRLDAEYTCPFFASMFFSVFDKYPDVRLDDLQEDYDYVIIGELVPFSQRITG